MIKKINFLFIREENTYSNIQEVHCDSKSLF